MNRSRYSRFESGEEVRIMKFGGTSVGDAEAIRRLIAIVKGCQDIPVLVVSALAGITDQLLEAGRSAINGHLGAALALIRTIYVRHESMAEDLGLASAALNDSLRAEFRELEAMLRQLSTDKQWSMAVQDRLLGAGECLSSVLITAALVNEGINAAHVDSRCCIVTDAQHGQAGPLWEETNQRVQDQLNPLLEAKKVPVLGGFIAATLEGVPTTLGRGGSDFTASILGAALNAARVEIWTDVDGIMTADPKICPDARVIRKMSFEEGAELAHFGAKVLHPATIAPAMRESIPVYVLNSRNPEGAGTEIVGHVRSMNTVSAITAKRKVAMIEIESEHGIDSDLVRRAYAIVAEHSCSIDQMGASLGRISLLVAGGEHLNSIAGKLQSLGTVHWENHKALICLVGENIRRQPEIASRAFAAVADMDVRVVCQGASERTISLMVDESKLEESVQRLHNMFFPAHQPSRDWGGISVAFCQAG